MIPRKYFFMVDDGTHKSPPHVIIPAMDDARYIFESREDVDEFIKRAEFFRDVAFGKNAV